MNLSLELNGSRATIRVTGYLSRPAGENLSVLLRDLGRMEVRSLTVDISGCSPVCVGALEALLDAKFRLAAIGVAVHLSQPPSTVRKVFQIMGLQSDGEPFVRARRR